MKTINFQSLILESNQNYSPDSFNEFNNYNSEQTNRNEIIRNQFRLSHLKEEEKVIITELCLEFGDIFYAEIMR